MGDRGLIDIVDIYGVCGEILGKWDNGFYIFVFLNGFLIDFLIDSGFMFNIILLKIYEFLLENLKFELVRLDLVLKGVNGV